MIDINATPRAAVMAAWRAEEEQRSGGEDPKEQRRVLNRMPLVSLGETILFPFNGRGWKVRPISLPEAERLLEALFEAESHGEEINAENLRDYFRSMRKLRRIIWRNVQPTGALRRLLRILGLHRNPFHRATERQVIEIATFLSMCRMRGLGSGVSPMMAKKSNQRDR
jgi:hypothetical protein